MKAIIVDDEAHCIGTLQILLQDYIPIVEIIGTCRNGHEGIAMIAAHKPDLLFLDIAMPKMNGFEMLERIQDPTFEIIFTTAYDQYALQAFKVSAIDYLLKPIDKEELILAVEKVRKKIGQQRSDDDYKKRWSLFLENIQKDHQRFPNIAFPTAVGIEMIPARDIMYAEANGNYSQLHLTSGEKFLVSKTLKEVDDTLQPYGFLRVHHSYLVNALMIRRYVRGEGGYVVLQNGQHFNVSRRRKDVVIQALNVK